MQSIQGVEQNGGRTGARERRGDLASDLPGLADAEDDDFSSRFDRFFDQLDGVGEILIQPLPQSLQFKDLDIENASGLFKIVHRYIIVGRGVPTGKNLQPNAV